MLKLGLVLQQEDLGDLDKMVNKRDGTPQKIVLGEENGQSKLEICEVIEVIKLRKAGKSYSKIAKRFNVSVGTIQPICIGKTWRKSLKLYFNNCEDKDKVLEFYDSVNAHGSKEWKKKVSKKCRKAVLEGKHIPHEALVKAGRKSASLKTKKQIKKFNAAGIKWIRNNRDIIRVKSRNAFNSGKMTGLVNFGELNFIRGGIHIKSSIPQDKLFEWAKEKFSNERVAKNYPFEFNGKYAFGDVVFLDRKLVIEYDGVYWHNKRKDYDEKRDNRILQNGFYVYRTNHINFKELERVINSYLVSAREVL